MSNPVGWARVWPTAHPRDTRVLRQGVWYPVLDESQASAVVLDVLNRQVKAPRRLFEIRDRQPNRFTVVCRPRGAANPAQGTRDDLGRTYAVCPTCGQRVRLTGEPTLIVCPRCEHRGEVAWWETG